MLLTALLLLSGEYGGAAVLVDDSLPPRTVVLEAVNVLECVAPPDLDIPRWLPAAPLSVAVDTKLQVRPGFVPGERARLRAGDRLIDLGPQRKVLAALVPPMLERAREAATDAAKGFSIKMLTPAGATRSTHTACSAVAGQRTTRSGFVSARHFSGSV